MSLGWTASHNQQQQRERQPPHDCLTRRSPERVRKLRRLHKVHEMHLDFSEADASRRVLPGGAPPIGAASIEPSRALSDGCFYDIHANVWWLTPATVLMFACAASSIPFGSWVLATSRWPSWMKGLLKWPLGDRITDRVIRLQGWSYLFVGAASLVLTVLLLASPSLLANNTLLVRWLVGGVLSITVLLLLCGVVPYVRSVVLSYRP